MNHPEEVGGMPFPARDDAAVVMEPGKEPFNFPPTPRATQRASVLGTRAAVRVMPGDHLDAIALPQMRIKPVAVVAAIADQAWRERIEEGRVEGGIDERNFMRRSTGHVDGERKTMAVANRHDFAALTAASRADGGAPFFAELKLASMKASDRSSLPRSRRSSAKPCSTRSSTPVRCHAWNRRWQVWYGGYRAGRSCQGAPVRSTHSTPLSTARVSAHGRPRPSARRTGRNNGSRISHCGSVRSMPSRTTAIVTSFTNPARGL